MEVEENEWVCIFNSPHDFVLAPDEFGRMSLTDVTPAKFARHSTSRREEAQEPELQEP